MRVPNVPRLTKDLVFSGVELHRWLVGIHEVFKNKVGFSDKTFVIDGGGSAITVGVKGYFTIPFACEIESVTLLADVSGSIVVDVWKDAYANYPPTVADSITASAKPEISSDVKSTDDSLYGWTKTINAGDVLAFNVDSCTTITQCSVILSLSR